MDNRHSEIIIAGISQVPVGEHWDQSLRQLAAKVTLGAIKDSGGIKPEVMYIGNLLAVSASRQANLGSLFVENAGLNGIEGVTVEAGDASGGAALRMAYLTLRSGAAKSALVVGAEKTTDLIGAEAETRLSQVLDADFEGAQGLTPHGLADLLFQRYRHEYKPDRSTFGGFAAAAHANGASNPFAMYRKKLPDGAYQKAIQFAEGLTIYDLAPIADGAAAVILVREDALPDGWSGTPVRLIGSSLVTDTLSIHDRSTPLVWDAARLSIERACRDAGTMPANLDFFEYHDATALHAALSLEAAGFASMGQGWMMAKPDMIGLKGKIPTATFGGLKARGHPLGATGVYQAVEAALQLRGKAGENQVAGARLGMIQSLSSMASTAVVHILSL